MDQHNKKIRVGLMLDAQEVPAWVYAMLEKIQQSDYASIDLVVLNKTQPAQTCCLGRLLGNWRYWLFNLYRKIDNRLLKSPNNAFAIKDASGLLQGIPVLGVVPEQTRFSDLIEDRDLEEIKKHEVDVLIRLGFRILKGKILTTPKFGVWSYHHGDSEMVRGGPAGFWEVFEKHPVTGATLQVLTEELDKGLVLAKTFSATDMLSACRNRNNYYWNSMSLLPRKLRELRDLGEEKFFEKARAENAVIKFSPEIRRCPKNLEFILIFVRQLARLALSRLRKYLFVDQWILLADLGKGISGPLNRFKKILPPKDRLWADPFVLQKENKYYIFLEEMVYREKKGHISLIVMDEQGNYGAPVKVLERPYHLSYPFIFEWNGDHYMIPESGANKTIDAYKCTRFPDKWEFHSTLMKEVKAADTTVYFHQGKWWLFTNIQENEGDSNWDELFLFYSDNPLSDNWTPHSQNPIVSDVRRARPAGRLFEQDGNIYRPSQDCSKLYGYGLRVNQILALNENEYKEVEVRFIEPDWEKNIRCVHTLNKAGRLTVIDAIYRRWLTAWIVFAYVMPTYILVRGITPDMVRTWRRMFVSLICWITVDSYV